MQSIKGRLFIMHLTFESELIIFFSMQLDQ